MKPQKPFEFPLQENVEMKKMGEGRYYVQSLTESVFIVRKCLSGEGKSGPDDHIVRSFDIYHDASSYADNLNSEQHG